MLHASIAVFVGAALMASTAGAQMFEPPVRLKADGEFIDTGEHIAHAGPLFADYDGDGVKDLIVGNYSGYLQLYKNVGTDARPKLTSKGLLERGGEPIRIHNW